MPEYAVYADTFEGQALINASSVGVRAHALGEVRVKSAPPMFDLSALYAASTSSGSSGSLPNPNSSQGCSPILRALFLQSGLPHAVVSELADDGQDAGHLGGNAIDVAPAVLSGSVATGQLRAIGDLVKRLAPLFAFAAFYFEAQPASSVFVWDGAVVDLDDVSPGVLSFAKQCTDRVHVASSSNRLAMALVDPIVSNLLGGTANEGTGSSLTVSMDREVYVLAPRLSSSVVSLHPPKTSSW